MKSIIVIIMILFTAQLAGGAIPDAPDVTVLVNDPTELFPVDSFLIGITNKGVAVYEYNNSDSLYHLLNMHYQKIDAEKFKVYDTLLIYKANNDQLHFMNLTALPEITYAGFIDFNTEFSDFILKNDNLYLSMYFKGVSKYGFDSYSSASFIDSSMTGILVTQLEEKNDTLYVLDEYNGLLRYDIASSDFGSFIDYMYIPFRVKSFIKDDSLYYLNLNNDKLFRGQFKQPGESIVDSTDLSSEINLVYDYKNYLLLFSARELFLLDKSSFNLINSFNIENSKPGGACLTIDNHEYLLLPSNSGGVDAFSLDGSFANKQMLYYGRFADFSMFENSLFLSAVDQPVSTYNVNDQLDVFESYKIYNQFNNSYKMTANGDSLIVIYPNLNETAFIYASSDQDLYFLENSFALEDKQYYEIEFQKQTTHDYNLLLMDLFKGYDVYSISQSGVIQYQREWSEINNKSSFSLLGDKIVTSDGTSKLLFYNIQTDFTLEYYYQLNVGNRVLETIQHENYLYAFDAGKMYQILIAPDTPYVIESQLNLPYEILNADIEANRMIGIGSGGMVEIDLSNPIPELISWGGLGGNKLIFENGIAVTSNGFDLGLYYLNHVTDTDDEQNLVSLPDKVHLSQNYPNPFNLETIVSFSLPSSDNVDLAIYNILGQKVKQLVSEKLPAGVHTYFWDGKNETGGVVASGLYFYKLSLSDFQATKKMMLIK